jgi:excisionase family DNA binding protein
VDGYLTIKQTAERLGVSAVAVARWIDKGQLPAYRLGGRLIRIKVEDADAMLRPVTPSK